MRTELALTKLLVRHRITGCRRQVEIRGRTRSPLRAATRKPKTGAHGATRPIFCVKPDFVFKKLKLAIFVDGCFWHGCPKHGTLPVHNRAFWRRKFFANKNRDKLVNRALCKEGWRVLRIWECALARRREKRTLNRLVRAFRRIHPPRRESFTPP